jgi:hypothetical protein
MRSRESDATVGVTRPLPFVQRPEVRMIVEALVGGFAAAAWNDL